MNILMFTWARNPSWPKIYAFSPEIWQYLKDVATKYKLEKHIKFSYRVHQARWDENDDVWRLSITTPDGSIITDQCDILANGTGVLKSVVYFAASFIEVMPTAVWDQS
ncbi:putative monooxygenase [Grosmannia clavigera kw1407]|uniref:Putative monooxygenase n=1 Tax=Grosmannia clavigera (strain kw1407 / UAMH 11150) TaxID=655863 RepID=F0XA82_GROCL|nr:putative monooxygenase [Grosmannia clavigera kw1407]EFX05514.1 putative monooxygenase [Grosmannia clavigera kw1407]